MIECLHKASHIIINLSIHLFGRTRTCPSTSGFRLTVAARRRLSRLQEESGLPRPTVAKRALEEHLSRVQHNPPECKRATSCRHSRQPIPQSGIVLGAAVRDSNVVAS